jgi:lysine 2,3-aminomutase
MVFHSLTNNIWRIVMKNFETVEIITNELANGPGTVPSTVNHSDVQSMMDRYHYSDEMRKIIKDENLLPTGLLSRLQASYPQHSGFLENRAFLFIGRDNYTGLKGFREVNAILKENGVDIGYTADRELFVEVYRFLATRHTLNSIDWDNFENDSVFQLVMPQPGMIDEKVTKAYAEAATAEERTRIAVAYQEETNPHDGNQQLNKPWFKNNEGEVEFLDGSQHKYPQCQLVFDRTTQNCFSFCTYCFRHAQVRGDEDMFIQKDIQQIHSYLRQHPEVTDLLITGGDGGYMPVNRLEHYVRPIIEDPALLHVKNVRLATRVLTFQPEMILSSKYDKMLELFDTLRDNGVQLAWMAHFSTPRELLNPSTIAAIRRLQNHGVNIRSQSPMMNHISLFKDEDGVVDVEKSAQNWIDLAEILGMMCIGFHSMYAARPTGEHHYFTAPLADYQRIFNRIYRSLASINRPSRHLSMTISAGKLAIMGYSIVNGEKCFALQFTEARNMEWMDQVFLAKWDEEQNKINMLQPFESDKYFFEDELKEIEENLAEALRQRLSLV